MLRLIMKNKILFVLFILLNNYISGQTMKIESYKNVEYFVLTKKEMLKLIKENKYKTELVENHERVYFLEDNRVIFEMIDVKNFLFSSKEDFLRFKGKVIEESLSSVQNEFEIRNTNLYVYDEVINFLSKELNKDITNENILELIETTDKNLLLRHGSYFTFLLGSHIIKNNPDIEWKYLKISKDYYTYVLINSIELINISFLLNEFNKGKEDDLKKFLYNRIPAQGMKL